MSHPLRLFLAAAAVHGALSAGSVALLARTALDGTSPAPAALAPAAAVLLFPLGYAGAWLAPAAPWLAMALNSLLWGGGAAFVAARRRRRRR